MEYSYINLYLDNNFTLEQMPNNYIINMLDYINYRILYIWSSDE